MIVRCELALDGERWHHRTMSRRKATPDDDTSEEETKPEPRAHATSKPDDETQPVKMKKDEEEVASRETVQELPQIVPPDPKAEPWPDATPQPMKPVEAKKPERSHTETVGMPVISAANI